MKWINTHMASGMMARAADSNRKRTNHKLHASAEEPVQRYCIAGTRDSYFRPHRHPHNGKLATAAAFAPWAPEEESDDARPYVQQLKELTSHG